MQASRLFRVAVVAMAACSGCRSDGHFEVSRLASQGLLPEMGLATGDVILAVDGATLNSLDSVMRAAG